MSNSSRLTEFFQRGKLRIHSVDSTGRTVMARPWRVVMTAVMAATIFLSASNFAQAKLNVDPAQLKSGSGVEATVTPAKVLPDEAAPDLNALPMTQESQYLQQLQARFGNARPDLPIYYFDSDKMQLERLLLNARDNPHEGVGPVSIQVAAGPGGYLIGDLATDIRDDLEVHSASSRRIKVGVHLKESSAKTAYVCTIVPNDPQVSLAEDAAGIMGIYGKDLQGFFMAYGDNPFNLALGRRAMTTWTNYHETAHCLDRYFVEARGDFEGSREFFRRSQGEAFADVVSTFLMSQDGYQGFGYQLGAMRAIGTMRNGPRSAASTDEEDWGRYGGAVYYTTPAIYAAQKYIDSLPPSELQALTLDQITALSADFVKTNGLTYAQFEGLFQYHKLGDKYRNALGEMAKNQSAVISGPAKNMLSMLDAYDGTTSAAKLSILGAREPASTESKPRDYQYRRDAMLNWGEILKSAYAKGGDFKALAAAVAEFRDSRRAILEQKDPDYETIRFPVQPVLHAQHAAEIAKPAPTKPAAAPKTNNGRMGARL